MIDKKPREFWLSPILLNKDLNFTYVDDNRSIDAIHVIEWKAFDDLFGKYNDITGKYLALEAKYIKAVGALTQIRDAPGLGGLDYRSTKKWREVSMEVIDHIATDTLKELGEPELAKPTPSC